MFYIEYEIFPFRSIYLERIKAKNEEEARKIFFQKFPEGRIRKIDKE